MVVVEGSMCINLISIALKFLDKRGRVECAIGVMIMSGFFAEGFSSSFDGVRAALLSGPKVLNQPPLPRGIHRKTSRSTISLAAKTTQAAGI